ncbi:MAG: twin-arginine translocation signal domain-containing protein, partial [Victivallales bacterium]|nr:twin-arginine translocation signal domain-containing protein [Victivallales bacterium]
MKPERPAEMDRRDFIKGIAAAAALGALGGFAGCSEPVAKKTVRSRGAQITRRPWQNTDLTLPLLGFGMMRLPT